MKTAIVAGGAGFIGSHLSQYLLDKSFKVVCLDNLLTGSKVNVDRLSQNPNFQFIQCNISEPLPEDMIGSVGAIFHLASPASPNKNSKTSYYHNPIETLLVNSEGTRNLLELARVKKAQFLYASTSEIYGDPLVSPQKEDYFGNVNPNGIRSVYDEAKRFGEAVSMAYFRKYGIDVRIIRIFNTFGPHMQVDDGRVISNFITQALRNQPITIYGDGSQTRSFCYIDDMVLGIYKAMFEDNTKGEVINLGNTDERSIAELATIIKDKIHSSSQISFGDLPEDDPKTRKPDITKAHNVLGWRPQTSLDEGLSKTIEYFRGAIEDVSKV